MDCLLLGTSGHIGTACFLLGRETLLEFLRIDFILFIQVLTMEPFLTMMLSTPGQHFPSAP